MTRERVARRLAAILAADVVGYSRLMGRDEQGTLARLKAHRSERLEPALARHGGRLVKLTGDGALVEFPSAVDALGAAIEFQQAMAEANLDQPEGTRIVFRIGLHLGDLIVDGDDLYGDGVNVAARLEAEAKPGGIVISGDVYNAVTGRLKASFDDLSSLALKNIERPMRAFGVKWEAADWKVPSPPALASAIEASPGIDAPTSLPNKPSIAVLPFQNMSGDPEQEYFADGMVEDIITALSHFRSLLVISRNSSFTYKGRNVDVKQVGSELGVRYVLEGSVRRAGNRLRITAQLIETDKASHVWAERYDREYADVFAVQDEISSRIAAVIEPELGQHEQRHAQGRPPASLEAWDCVNRGLFLLYKFTKDSIAASRPFFERAIALDAGFSRAYTSLAYTHQLDVLHGYTDDRERSVQEHLRLAKLGVQFDDADSYAHIMLCFAYCRVGQFDLAMAEARKAADANPYDTWAQGVLARVLDLVGRSREAIPHIERSIALNPRDPHVKFYLAVGAQALINARDYPLAESWARKAIESDPAQARPHLLLAIAVAQMGRVEEARSALDACEAAVPGFVSKWASWREYSSESDREHMRDGLLKAGGL